MKKPNVKVRIVWDHPSLDLLVKLGSAIVHADEYLGPGSHPYDLDGFRSLLHDPEVKAWLDEGTGMAFLPIKRDRRKP